MFSTSLFRRAALSILLGFSVSITLMAQGRGGGLIPDGGFEKKNAFHRSWELSSGKAVFEDSISQEGEHSLLLISEAGRIDISLVALPPLKGGTYELSFWYRGVGPYQEAAPFWVEVNVPKGKAPNVFRFGTEEVKNGLMRREWVYFSEELELNGGRGYRLFIHSGLPRIWIDGLRLEKKS